MGVKQKGSLTSPTNVGGGVGKSFKEAERNVIETGKLLQLYEINPTLSRFGLGNEGLWLVEVLGDQA
jgi:hypothetical protein